MKKTLALFAGLMLCLSADALSLQNGLSLHVYNPLALFQKAGVKVEYKKERIGYLATALQYYGDWPRYPGTLLGLEGRFYNKRDSVKRKNTFFYSKIFGGYQQHVDQSGDSFLSRKEVPSGNYFGAGLGYGRKFTRGRYFLDVSAGLKYAISSVQQEDAFYLTGPASYVDLYFNLGYTF